MKVLWITNVPIRHHKVMLGVGTAQSGGWIDAALTGIIDKNFIELGIVTVSQSVSSIEKDINSGVTYYVLPSKKRIIDYDYLDRMNKKTWTDVFNDFCPDIIHFWGTEFPHTLCAISSVRNVPTVVYMQGMVAQICNHYYSGISTQEIIQNTTLGDIVGRNSLFSIKNRYIERAKIEAEILKRASHVIVENEWCGMNCLAINPKLNVHYSLLPINSIFSSTSWSIKDIEPFSIMTTAGPSPIKGHHMLLKAFGKVVQEYPSAKLYIPGDNTLFSLSLRYKLKRKTYPHYLMKLIDKYKLRNNIVFMGKLSQEQMLDRMMKSNVFIMPSSIENHSSSLIEALMVGIPSISSNVGGVSEYLHHNINGLLYRYDEPDVLAEEVKKIFNDKDFACKLSSGAISTVRIARNKSSITNDLINIYSAILQK